MPGEAPREDVGNRGELRECGVKLFQVFQRDGDVERERCGNHWEGLGCHHENALADFRGIRWGGRGVLAGRGGAGCGARVLHGAHRVLNPARRARSLFQRSVLAASSLSDFPKAAVSGGFEGYACPFRLD